MSKHDKSPARRPFYIEKKCFDGTYRPCIWWCDAKPTETTMSGQKVDIQNVRELSMEEVNWTLDSLYEMFNPVSAS